MFNWFLLFPWARTDSWQGGFSSIVIVVVTIVTFVGLCWNPGMEGALDLKSPALKQVGRVRGYLHPLMHWLVSLFYVESLGYSPNNQGVVPQCRRGLLIGRSLSPLHTSSHHVQNLRQNFTDFSFPSSHLFMSWSWPWHSQVPRLRGVGRGTWLAPPQQSPPSHHFHIIK